MSTNTYVEFIQQQKDKRYNPYADMTKYMAFDCTNLVEKAAEPKVQHSEEQLLASKLSGYDKKGFILPSGVARAVMKACRPMTIAFENMFDLYHFQKNAEEQDSRWRTMLFDRLRGGVNKEGERFPVGSMKQDVAEHLFCQKYHATREWYMRRAGKGNKDEDWKVEIHFEFPKGHQFLSTLECKEATCIDQIGTFKNVERQVFHFYTALTFRLNCMNGMLQCDWQQDSVKIVDGKAISIN